MTSMPTVLVLCDTPQSLKAQRDYCDALSDNVHFLFLIDPFFMALDMDILQGKPTIHIPTSWWFKWFRRSQQLYTKATVQAPSSGKKRWLSRMKTLSVVEWGLSIVVWLLLLHLYRSVSRALCTVSIDAVIVNGDRGYIGLEHPLLKWAKRRGIPSIRPHFIHISNGHVIRRHQSELYVETASSWFSKWVYRRRLDQSVQYEGKHLFYYRAFILKALERFGTLSTYPWMMGNGCLDHLCVDSEQTKREALANRVPAEKIHVVGQFVYDGLVERLKAKASLKEHLYRAYNVTVSHSIVLSLPQLAEHGILSWEDHDREIAFLVDTLLASGCHLFISLHPKMNPEYYQHFNDREHCSVLKEPLSEVLPIADYFVSMFSSTTYWAVLCGIPVFIVDFYGLNYSDFDFLQSMALFRDKERFKEAMSTIHSHQVSFEDDWVSLSRSEVFDGATAQRYKALFDRIGL